MASTHPIVPNPLHMGDVPEGGRPSSRRSSTSGQARTLTEGDFSKDTKPSTRGRKPFEISQEVDQGLVRILDSTDVSFDKLAQAVEECGGPRKLWLRRRFERITDTKSFGLLRLRNHREGAEERRQRQQNAMGRRVPDSPQHDGFDSQVTLAESSPRDSFSAKRWVEPQFLDSRRAEFTTQLVLPVPSTQVVPVGQRRASTLSSASKDGGASNAEIQRSDTSDHPKPAVNLGRSLTTPTPNKRPFAEDSNDAPETDYGARKDRTRALSLSAIISRLEDLTGQTGLYDHIKRISVKSHLSPGIRSFRFPRGSRRASEASTAATNSMYEQTSPNGVEAGPVIYDPDPDYETFYHDPTPGRMAQLQSRGVVAMASLMKSKVALVSDEDAESNLRNVLPKDQTAVAAGLNEADDTGVTALHIAVAYGWPRVSRFLMQSGANPFAMTNRGSSVCRFARPAQDFAKETSVYHRILYCRQWICAGIPPPIAGESEMANPSDLEEGRRRRHPYKRRRTNDTTSALFTVIETPVEEVSSSLVRSSTQSSAMPDRPPGLTPLITGFDYAAVQPMHGYSAEQAISGYDETRNSIIRRSCVGDHNIDMLTPSSLSPTMMFWPDGSTAAAIPHSQGPVSLESTTQALQTTSAPFGPLDGLNILSNFPNDEQFSSSSTFLDQFNPVSQDTSTHMFVPEVSVPYDWSATALHDPGQMIMDPTYIPNAVPLPINNQTFHQRAPGSSQPPYPTPPSESRAAWSQVSWPHEWDVPSATARALSGQPSSFPSLWYDDYQPGPTSNSFYQNDDAQYPYERRF